MRTSESDGHHERRPIWITIDGRKRVVYAFVAGAPSLTAEIHGYVDDLESGGFTPEWAELDVPGSGEGTPGPGVVLADGVELAPHGVGYPVRNDMVEITIDPQDSSTLLPIKFQAVARAGGEPLNIAGGGPIVAGVTSDSLVCYVTFATFGITADNTGTAGNWLLEASEDGSALVWERIPSPEISYEFQVRHMTVAPDGGIYLMVPTEEGMAIYQRTP